MRPQPTPQPAPTVWGRATPVTYTGFVQQWPMVSQHTDTQSERGITFGCRPSGCRIWAAAAASVSPLSLPPIPSSRPSLSVRRSFAASSPAAAAGPPSHPSRSPRPRPLGTAATATGSPLPNAAPPSPAGASAAVRTPASGGSGNGGDMDHIPPPPPPPAQPPPVAVAAMAGATAAAAAARESAAALTAPFPAPNGGGARTPSDSGGGEAWGGASAGGAAVNAAAASARKRTAAPRTTPYRAWRAVRPPAGRGVGRHGPCTWLGGVRAPQWPWQVRPHARAGGWVGLVASSARRPTARRRCWSRAVAHRRMRGGCVGRVWRPRWWPRRQRWCGRRQLPPAVWEPSPPGRWVASVCLNIRTECALVVPWSAIAGLNHKIQSTRLTRSTFPGVWTHHPHSEAADPDVLRNATYPSIWPRLTCYRRVGRILRTEPCQNDPQQWSIHCVQYRPKRCAHEANCKYSRACTRKQKKLCVWPHAHVDKYHGLKSREFTVACLPSKAGRSHDAPAGMWVDNYHAIMIVIVIAKLSKTCQHALVMIVGGPRVRI